MSGSMSTIKASGVETFDAKPPAFVVKTGSEVSPVGLSVKFVYDVAQE